MLPYLRRVAPAGLASTSSSNCALTSEAASHRATLAAFAVPDSRVRRQSMTSISASQRRFPVHHEESWISLGTFALSPELWGLTWENTVCCPAAGLVTNTGCQRSLRAAQWHGRAASGDRSGPWRVVAISRRYLDPDTRRMVTAPQTSATTRGTQMPATNGRSSMRGPPLMMPVRPITTSHVGDWAPT
jgi:hypothetical protein